MEGFYFATFDQLEFFSEKLLVPQKHDNKVGLRSFFHRILIEFLFSLGY